MPIHVKVLSHDDYAKWVDARKKEMAAKADDPNKVWKIEDLIARGEKIYAANCAVCHRPDGKGAGAIKPLDGSAKVLDKDHAVQLGVVLNGFNNGAMPAWKQLSDTEIAAVATYTKNAWSNKTGQIIQPSEVAAVRAGKAPVQAESAASPAPAATPAPAAAPAAAPASAGLPVSVLFASGQSALDDPAKKAVAAAVEYLKAHPEAKVGLSGFVDSSGDPAKNAELAKQRAITVRDALAAAGVAADRIDLSKPPQIEAGSADAARARRVDIVQQG